MIKLLKYDWKRNATVFAAALCILIVVQAALTALHWYKDWDYEPQYVITSMVYGLCGFLASLAACMTFNANIRAYSRGLLPLPSLYIVLSPLALLIIAHIAIGLLFILHDAAYFLVFEGETISSLAIEHLNGLQALSLLLAYAWGLIFIAIVIFFVIAFSRMSEAKLGAFLAIIVCIAIFTAIAALGSFIFPEYGGESSSFGFFRIESGSSGGDFNEVSTIIPFGMMQLGEVLYELVWASVLVYGIVYMMDRKLKL